MSQNILKHFFKYRHVSSRQIYKYIYIIKFCFLACTEDWWLWFCATCCPLPPLNPADRWLRWPSSQRTGHSLLRAGGPRSSPSYRCPPGEAHGCWRLGWPLQQRSRWCWRFRGDPWDASCCPCPYAGHTCWCALHVFCPVSRWLPQCICQKR